MVDHITPEASREACLNKALEALFFAFRAVIAKPDARLAGLGFSRVHHRILYFVGRNPRLGVNELLRILGVSKQYLNRPLRQLMEKGHVSFVQDGQDRRVKRLSLTKNGQRLERELSGAQRMRFAKVFAKAGSKAEEAWRMVMKLLADPKFD
ncbi:MAG: winged helix-turn-helix transcriptional regulator [Nitrospinae bacterium]|nr:winged helix-turn-helix transcriptional regulator [Nitrospinota bacterium]